MGVFADEIRACGMCASGQWSCVGWVISVPRAPDAKRKSNQAEKRNRPGRSSGQTENDDDKDTDRDRRAVTHP